VVGASNPHPRSAPTIIDVAREAGVSKSTISRILNGSPNVLPETEARVFAAMERLGYQANQAARSLRTRRSQLVGVVVPSLNEVYAAQAEAVDTVLRPNGKLTVVSTFGWSVDACIDTIHTLRGRGIDGLIVGLPDDSDPRIVEVISEAGPPVVLLDREIPGVIYDAVLTDQEPGMFEAIRHLTSAGRRRIGLIAMTRRTRPGRAALAAYGAALTSEGIEYRPDLVVQTDTFDRESGYSAARHLISHGVDAVIAATPVAALAGVMACLADEGLAYPADVSLIGFHEHELSLAKRPKLSVIARDVREIGTIAGQMILTRLERPDDPSTVAVVPTWFVPGESSDPRSMAIAAT
jgi:LacI family transcriptional regulator